MNRISKPKKNGAKGPCYFVKKIWIFSEEWLQLLNDSLSYEVANVRLAAVAALPILLNHFYASPDKLEINRAIVENYASELRMEVKQSSRMGHALALGSLPKHILQPNFDFIVQALVGSTATSVATAKWAESRRDGIKALTLVVSTMADEIGKGSWASEAFPLYLIE